MATMTHPALDGATIEVDPSAVPIHMASGWVPVDGKATAAAEAAQAAEAEKQASADSSADEDEATAPSRKTRQSAKES